KAPFARPQSAGEFYQRFAQALGSLGENQPSNPAFKLGLLGQGIFLLTYFLLPLYSGHYGFGYFTNGCFTFWLFVPLLASILTRKQPRIGGIFQILTGLTLLLPGLLVLLLMLVSEESYSDLDPLSVLMGVLWGSGFVIGGTLLIIAGIISIKI